MCRYNMDWVLLSLFFFFWVWGRESTRKTRNMIHTKVHSVLRHAYLSVEKDGHVLAAAGRQGLPEALQGAGVPLVVAVGEVEPGNIHAGVDEGAERLDAPARGAEGADDLDLPARLIALGEDLVLAGVRVRV